MPVLILGLLAFTVLWPLWFTVGGALMASDELTAALGPALLDTADGGYAVWTILPSWPTLQPLAELLLDTPQFFSAFWNTCLLAFAQIAGQLVVAAPASWAFAKLRFAGRRFLLLGYIALMVLPFQVLMVPNYLIATRLGIYDTPLSVILPGVFSAFPVFIMTRSFQDVPNELLAGGRTCAYSGMKIRKAVLLLACAVSWGIAVWFAGRLWAAYPLVSVRSDVPVTGRQLEALRSALRQEDGASALVPAFWSQAEGSAESRWETCGITAILYCGEYDAVYPAVLLEGRFPAAQENGKCAVSTAAAWQLWGSEDVLGQELEIEGDIYRVCGLFRSSASLALCGESLDHGFSNIEFWGGYAAPPVETVQQLLRAAGIAQQVTLYFPFPWIAALTAYALCPAGLVLLAAARTLGGRVRRGCPKETCWFVLGGAFLLALVLPALLRLLPPWITPARWSDFSYWGGLLPAVGKAIETGFSLNPCAKDVLAKWNTLGLLIAATLANAAAGKLMLSRQQKNSTNL